MTDKELLELAAKAAGIEIKHWIGSEPHSPDWNPLKDDGDALRLAVKLKLWVQPNEMSVEVECWQEDDGETKTVTEYFNEPEECAVATRRAIVRAAAEIGKGMK